MTTFLHNILPYKKYIFVFIFITVFVIVNRKFIKDPVLRKWLIASLSVDNDVTKGSSGKGLSGFVFSGVIVFASIMAVLHSPNFLMPDYMFIGLLSFVAALYGIKMAGKFATGGSIDNSNQNIQTNNTNTPTPPADNTDTQNKP